MHVLLLAYLWINLKRALCRTTARGMAKAMATSARAPSGIGAESGAPLHSRKKKTGKTKTAQMTMEVSFEMVLFINQGSTTTISFVGGKLILSPAIELKCGLFPNR